MARDLQLSRSRPSPLLGLVWVLALWACDDGGVPSGAGAATVQEAGIAVVCSDYASTAIALLDPSAERVTAPLLIHSGSVSPGVLVALSGDVRLPTSPVTGGAVVLLDRYPNGVVSWVDPVSARVIRQADVGPDFEPNVHDVLELGGGRWLATRFARNPSPGPASALDAGDDIVILGPQGRVTHALSASDEDGFPGRPDQLLARGEEIWVSLGRASVDFQTWRDGGLGRLSIDAAGQPVWIERHSYAETRSCGGLATDGARVALTCAGTFDLANATVDPQRAALLLLGEGGAEVARLRATDPRVGAGLADVVAFGADGRVYVVAFGDLQGAPDRVLAWRAETDELEEVFRAAEPFVLSSLSTNREGAIVLPVAERAAGRVCVLGEGPARCLDACAATGLLPRQVRRLVPGAVPGARP